MKRSAKFLDWLNHDDRPPEAQSPIRASALAVLVSFITICWLDSRAVSLFRVWWAQLLLYALIPILLAFIILYRSSWHQEMANTTRSFLAALMSCAIFGGVMLGMGVAMVLLALVYYSHFANFMGYH